MAAERVHIEVGERGVALLTIDNPPMNALHPTVLKELFLKLDGCHNNDEVVAILIAGASGKFSAGFDIQVFREATDEARTIVAGSHAHLSSLVESAPKPTVAMIDGICLGGGCELAVACSARVCTPASKIGLPELQLGIIPGMGGTQRLPRLVGLKKGLEMMLTSKALPAKEAKVFGLVDAVVDRDRLLSESTELALAMASGEKPWTRTLERTDKLEPFSDALQIFQFAHQQSSKQAPALEHPHLCIDAVRHGVEHGGYEGIKKEIELFARCLDLDTHKALLHFFFAARSTKRVKGITDVGLAPQPIKRIGVLGGGLMGSGIATSLLLAGCSVLLKEVNEKFLDSGLSRIRANVQKRMKEGRLSKAAGERALSNLKGVLDYSEFGSLDMVIEAVLENVSLKQGIFSDLERYCSERCILATNTSTIDINLVGSRTRAADRIVGAHFFSPAHVMPLLEIVRSEHTSKQVLVDTIELAAKIKKTPVVVGNCTGFAVNRVYFPFSMAALLLVDAGVDPYRIDKVIVGKFGIPYGPFRLMDLVGGDISMHVGARFVEAFPERVYVSQLPVLMNKLSRIGEKTGAGYYKFAKPRKPTPDPELHNILNEARSAAGLVAQIGKEGHMLSDQDIIDIILFPVVNEGCRVIAEGIVSKPSDLDVASILGMGFPPYRGGVIFWADLVGSHHICSRLSMFAKMFPRQAGFFEPCPYLKERAQFKSSLEQQDLQIPSRL